MEKRTQVKEFRIDSTLERYTHIIELNFDNFVKCYDCDKHIFYYDTKLIYSKKDIIKISGKNYNSIIIQLKLLIMKNIL